MLIAFLFSCFLFLLQLTTNHFYKDFISLSLHHFFSCFREDDVASPIPGNVAPSPTTSRLEMTRPEANQQQATVVRHSSDWDFSDEEEIAKSTEIHHTTFKSSNQKSFSIRHEKDNKSDNEIKENRPENVEYVFLSIHPLLPFC